MVHTGLGGSFTLCCQVTAEPKEKVEWVRNRRQWQWAVLGTRGQAHCLEVKSVTKTHFGQYSCIATNMLGRSEAHMVVVGNYQPFLKHILVTSLYFQELQKLQYSWKKVF